MHTDEKSPAGDGNPTAGYTDGAIVPGALRRIKVALVRAASWLAIVLRGLT